MKRGEDKEIFKGVLTAMMLAGNPEFSETILNAMGFVEEPEHKEALSAKRWGTMPRSAEELIAK